MSPVASLRFRGSSIGYTYRYFLRSSRHQRLFLLRTTLIAREFRMLSAASLRRPSLDYTHQHFPRRSRRQPLSSQQTSPIARGSRHFIRLDLLLLLGSKGKRMLRSPPPSYVPCLRLKAFCGRIEWRRKRAVKTSKLLIILDITRSKLHSVLVSSTPHI